MGENILLPSIAQYFANLVGYVCHSTILDFFVDRFEQIVYANIRPEIIKYGIVEIRQHTAET